MPETHSESRTTGDGAPNSASEPVASKGSETLDDLLKEYEGNSSREPAAAEGKNDVVRVLKGLQPLVKFAEGELNTKQTETLNKDVADAVSKVKSDVELLKDYPDKFIRGAMEAYAAEDPSFTKAFADRADNPAAWNEALDKGKVWMGNLAKEMPGNKVRDDIEAAKAAVAGTTDATAQSDDDGPSVAAMNSMSDVAWAAHMAEEIAKSER